jgi:hypothetical protein
VKICLKKLDPEGVARRYKRAVKRRVYKVAVPLSLVHIDGNHKLIRWKIVIHGGIDGFSRYDSFRKIYILLMFTSLLYFILILLTAIRFVTFLVANNNNRADTVLNCFLDSCKKYGLPSRVRVDYGVENYEVCRFMEFSRGVGRGSYIAGRSVHNVRIERLWRDVFEELLIVFYDLFSQMEAASILNVDSEVDIFLLHYIYIPILNSRLLFFQNGWNNHSVRTVNKKPVTLFSPVFLLGEAFQPIDDSGCLTENQAEVSELIRNSKNNVIVEVNSKFSGEVLVVLQALFPIVTEFDGNYCVDLFKKMKQVCHILINNVQP